MSKRKTGDFELTSIECALFNESVVQQSLSEHYQKMADAHTDEFIRSREKFWREIKKRDLPVHCTMTVFGGDRKLRITPNKKERAKEVK